MLTLFLPSLTSSSSIPKSTVKSQAQLGLDSHPASLRSLTEIPEGLASFSLGGQWPAIT